MAIALAAVAWTLIARHIAGRLNLRPFAVANLAQTRALRTALCGPSIAGIASDRFVLFGSEAMIKPLL